MGKPSAPAPPDYSELAAVSKESAELSYKLGKEQLDWAKEQYGKDSAITGKVVDQFLADMQDTSANAKKDRARYEQIFQPLEQDLATDAATYASPEKKDLEVGRAQANVAQQFTQAREQAKSQLEGYGINPSATRFAALDIGMRANEAAAKAAAGNQAALNVENTGRALRSEAINVGKGYPGSIAQSYANSTGQGNSAGGQQLATTASGASTMGTAPQWQQIGNSAVGQWGNILNTGYQNQLSAWQANQSASSGIGGALGIVGGIIAGLAEGGTVPESAIPAPSATGQGGAVPVDASPSRGAAIDDVPARLTPGEFVVPQDVVRWKGEEFMQNLIKKSREAKAHPDNARPAIHALPVDQQQQQQQALPA
jgi:hypothetical protein